MKLCPTCGEVYPDRSARCPAHRVELLDWVEISDTHSAAGAGEPGPEPETGPFMRAGDLTDPEVPLYAAPTPPSTVIIDDSAGAERPARILGGRYRLGEHLGIGGYGVVFAAYDERLGKRVAVKVLSPAVAQDAEIVSRFKREAIAASRVRHECIVDVTDYQVDPAGTSFIVMEYLGGSDLSGVIAGDAPLAPDRALAIAAQCASALTAAHSVGILHRDLKPSNVFIVDSASRPDFVKIIDFGIAKITNADGHYSSVTSASKVVGTPFYMPPEQARGQELDGRTDVYALGVILFEMLTGQRPFRGASALEILTNAINEPRVPPSRHRPELAAIARLDQLVMSAIVADRRHRFASMQEFGEAIVACLSPLAPVRALAVPAMVPVPEQASGDGAAPSPFGPTAPAPTLEGSSGELTRELHAGVRKRWPLVLLVSLLAVSVGLVWTANRSERERAAAAAGPEAVAGVAPPARATPPVSVPPDAAQAADVPDVAIAAPGIADAAAAPAPRTIRITSSPAGATVQSSRRGELGVTPLEVTLTVGETGDQLTLRHPGRADRTIAIDRTSAAELDVVLAPLRPRSPPAPEPPSPTIGIKDW